MAFVSGCSKGEESDKISPYQMEIFNFLGKYKAGEEFITNNDTSTYLLYYDNKLTCKTCIMDLMESIKTQDKIVILSNFESEKEMDFFKGTYKIDNKIINIDTQEFHLPVPFLFQVDKEKSYNILIFEDELINKKTVEKYMKKTKRGRFMFYQNN